MDRYLQATVTVSAGVLQAAPVTAPFTTEDTYLVDIEIIIPPGHAGFTGIRINQSGTQILPWGVNKWLSGNDYSRIFDVNTGIGAKSISITAYNEDVFVHSWIVRFHIRDRDTVQSPAGSDISAPLTDALNDISSPLDQPAPTPPGTLPPTGPITPGAPPPPALTASPTPQTGTGYARQQFTLLNQ